LCSVDKKITCRAASGGCLIDDAIKKIVLRGTSGTLCVLFPGIRNVWGHKRGCAKRILHCGTRKVCESVEFTSRTEDHLIWFALSVRVVMVGKDACCAGELCEQEEKESA